MQSPLQAREGIRSCDSRAAAATDAVSRPLKHTGQSGAEGCVYEERASHHISSYTHTHTHTYMNSHPRVCGPASRVA